MSFRPKTTGPIAWMARNAVAANLLMLALAGGGLFMGFQVQQEVFPSIELDAVSVAVPYPGASPEEVEQGILLAVEEAVGGLNGVKRITASAYEGAGTVRIELLDGVDRERVLADVQSAVDRIVSFPEDAERPRISLAVTQRHVISLALFGDVEEESLRQIAERVRQGLVAEEQITLVNLGGIRPREIAIEVPQRHLRTYGLTLAQVAQAVRRASVELPGGTVETSGGQILLRTSERRDLGDQFRDITLVSRADGTRVQLGDIADIRDGFRDNHVSAQYDGRRTILINVSRVGEQTPIEVVDAVNGWIEENRAGLPPGVQIEAWDDRSQAFRDRIDLLRRNATVGIILVFLTLGLFLEMRLAFWVMLGIPISFLGAFWVLAGWGVSINQISLFAFIVTLGIVVDDAIIVGENAYEKRQRGMTRLQAAVAGAQEVSTPVIFAVLTTAVAFSPLFFVPGYVGKLFWMIPAVVIAVLTISLIESLLVLPAHLAHSRAGAQSGFWFTINWPQRFMSRGLEWFSHRIYKPAVSAACRQRYLTAAIGIAIVLGTFGWMFGGHIRFTFMPRAQIDVISARARLPLGSPVEDTEAVRDRLVVALEQALEELEVDGVIHRGTLAMVGQGRGHNRAANSGSHVTDVMVQLVPPDQRHTDGRTVANTWKKHAGDIPGLDSLSFRFSWFGDSGASVDVELSHPDTPTLEAAATALAERIRVYEGVRDVDPGFASGKTQYSYTLAPAGRSLGLTEADLARQLRSAFYGAEALRQQRGRDEVRVVVRLPEADRKCEHGLETLLLRTQAGGDIPLATAARQVRGQAYTDIQREEGRRVLHVTADLDQKMANAEEILRDLEKTVLPEFAADYPGLRFEFGGQRRHSADTMSALTSGFGVALVVIFALLAVPFRSYAQPIIIMSVIPFGIFGAVFGHVVMGHDLSILSVMGMVALSGIVVNDSLLLIVTVNRNIEDGMAPFEAVIAASVRRLRPILLTSLTTFFGLAPMITETSFQAQFLIPMALSLGFGIIWATFILLLIVPAAYLIFVDAQALFGVDARKVGEEKLEFAVEAKE